jgi:cytochrome bd ubiquinol oxidase subunit I
VDIAPLLLSRLQFAFTISFHIIFPAFTVGLAAWLAYLQACSLILKAPVYDRLFAFWLRIFGIAFGLGVVSGIVMAFQFGTNWSELSRRAGPIQGPLLGYESFTAFAIEASFFGVLMLGRGRVSRGFYVFSCLMVCLGTTMSSFWIMVNNSWMQAPVGFSVGPDGVFIPTDWYAIIFSPVVWVRVPHMVLAAYVTTAFCVAATGALYALRGDAAAGRRAALPDGSHHLRRGVRHAGRIVPALHGAVQRHDPAGGGTARQLGLHVLGGRRGRTARHPGLHAGRLPRLQGQDRARSRSRLISRPE